MVCKPSLLSELQASQRLKKSGWYLRNNTQGRLLMHVHTCTCKIPHMNTYTHMPRQNGAVHDGYTIISPPFRLRQEHCFFGASTGYIVRLCFQNQTTQKQNQRKMKFQGRREKTDYKRNSNLKLHSTLY